MCSLSICLPMETNNTAAVTYLLTLLIANGAAFLLIVVCYGTMYWSITRNNINPCNSDTTVAKRMALLVFTDFACWAPIAFFGLTAVAGHPLIDVTRAKFLLVFFYPLNSCANPFLYAIFTKQYHLDLLTLFSRFRFCSKLLGRYIPAPTTNPIALNPMHAASERHGSSPSQVSDSLDSVSRRYCPVRQTDHRCSAKEKNSDNKSIKLQTVIEAKSSSQDSSSGTDSPHPVKNCQARSKFTPEQEAILMRYSGEPKRTNTRTPETNPSLPKSVPSSESNSGSLASRYLSGSPNTNTTYFPTSIEETV